MASPCSNVVENADDLAVYSAAVFDRDEHDEAAIRIEGLLNQINPPSWPQSARDQQLRGELSLKIAEFFEAITLTTRNGHPSATLGSPQWHDMQVMKRVTKNFLAATARMAEIRRAQRQTSERLFDGLENWILNASAQEALPEALMAFMKVSDVERPLVKQLSEGHYRAIADYICTMSDSEGFLRAQWISGTETPGMANLGLVE